MISYTDFAQVNQEDILRYGFNVYTNPDGLYNYKKKMWIYTSFFMSISFAIIGISLLTRYDFSQVKIIGGITLTIGLISGIFGFGIIYFYKIPQETPVLLTTIQPNATNAVVTFKQFLLQNRFYQLEINYTSTNIV